MCDQVVLSQNPVKAGKLFVKKGWYYWSPWSGPFANGTMARNPWLKVNPIMDIARGSQSGNDLVYKSAGKAISFFWVSWLHLTLLYWFLLAAFHEGHLCQYRLAHRYPSRHLLVGLDGHHRRSPFPYPDNVFEPVLTGNGLLRPAPQG